MVLWSSPRYFAVLDRSSIMSGMNKFTHESRCAVIRCLVEGCSIRSTVRTTGIAKNTIQKLTRDEGEACLRYQDKAAPHRCDVPPRELVISLPVASNRPRPAFVAGFCEIFS